MADIDARIAGLPHHVWRHLVARLQSMRAGSLGGPTTKSLCQAVPPFDQRCTKAPLPTLRGGANHYVTEVWPAASKAICGTGYVEVSLDDEATSPAK